MSQEIADRSIKQTFGMYSTFTKEFKMQMAAYDAAAFAMQFMLLAKERLFPELLEQTPAKTLYKIVP
nr:hypothetical protein [Paenibacillus xylanexedens]